MVQRSKKQAILRTLLIVSFIVGLQHKALAYNSGETDELLKNIIAFGFFGIFTIVSVVLYLAKSTKNGEKDLNMGSLFLKSIGITVLLFILFVFFAISLFE